MGQRNMLYTGPMIDMEMDQHAHLHAEPCVPYGGITNFPQPNGHTMLSPPGNISTFDSHHLPENHGAVPYGLTQYNGVENHHPGSNIALTPSSTRIFPVPLNHGPHDQLPFSGNHGGFEVSADTYGRNSHFMDGVGGSFKRKNAEGISGNFQYFYPSAGSSSSVAVPMSARPLESDITMMDSASFAIGEYRGNDIQSVMEAGPHRSVRNRSGAITVDSVLGHNGNHLMHGNYVGQPLPPVGTPWLDQQFCSNGGDAGTFSWNQAPGLPYLQGCINGGGMEANMGVQGYQVSAGNRNPTTFVHPPITPQGHHNLHHLPPPPPPMHGLRGHNMDFHSQVATAPRRLSANSTSYTGVNPFQNGVEPGPRFVGPTPPTGLRIHRPHRREVMLDSTLRHRSLPHLRVLPEDGVAILDVSEYHEVGHSVDHHRDMRLDIDHMSYEELLALGEQIGSVGSGLSDDFIVNHLKVRTFVASCSHLEGAACVDQELNFCVICQTDYENQEKIGILECGHEYHVDCIKKWLIVKNTCPICKSSALAAEKMES